MNVTLVKLYPKNSTPKNPLVLFKRRVSRPQSAKEDSFTNKLCKGGSRSIAEIEIFLVQNSERKIQPSEIRKEKIPATFGRGDRNL